MAILDIINNLDTAWLTRKEQEQYVLDLWLTGERDFFVAAQLAKNFDINYDLVSIPRIAADPNDTFVSSWTFNDFHILAKKLRTIFYSIDEKKSLMYAAAEVADVMEWNTFYRVILNNEFPWIEIKTINKMLRKLSLSDPTALRYLVSELNVQQYHTENQSNQLHLMRGMKTIAPVPPGNQSYRGVMVVDVDQKTTIMYMKSNSGPPMVMPQKIEFPYDSLPCSMAIECVLGSWSTVNSPIYLLDCLPLTDYYRGECSMTYSDRQAVLTGVLGVMLKMLDPKYKFVQKLTVDLNTELGRTNMKEFQETLIEEGVAEILVIDPNSPYRAGKDKTKSIIQFKNKVING